jgi:PST family polysaccharide transporter
LTASFEPKDRAALKGASINGLAITFAAQFTRFGLQFIYQVTLARLLTPREFGLVAMASPILAFVALFADFGLTQTTVQRRSINQAELTFLFWSNCALSCALAIVTAAFASLVGWFFAEPNVTSITMALGALFLLTGLSAQHTALLNRRLAFGKLAIVSLASFGIGAGVGIVAAMEGLSFWAIVIGQAATSLVSVPLAWTFTRWIPGRPRWVKDAGKLLGFGGNITTFNFLNYFARNLDNVLIGHFAGGAALGLYDRAYKLLLLPLTQINGPFTSVAMPLLARTRDEPAVYRRAYLQMLEVILLLTYPGVIFAVCTSQSLIVTVLGQRWAGVAPIFAVLGLGALFAPIGSSTGWLFITQERTREMRNWGMLSSLLFVASFVVGLPWGPLGVAISYITAGAFQAPVIWWVTTRTGPVSFRQLLTAIYPSAMGAGVTALVELVLQRCLPPGLPTLTLLFLIAYSTFVGVLASMSRGRAILKDVVMQGRRLVARAGERGLGKQDAELTRP